MKKVSSLFWLLALSTLLAVADAQSSKPMVKRPRRSGRKFTTALAVDGGGVRGILSSMVIIEIEASVKRYILANPSTWPRGANFTSADDFDVVLADFFDVISGVSAGSWITAYLASKGGNGASEAVFSNRRTIRRYGRIIPGGAKGLEVFFMENAESFYPGGIRFNVTPPAITPNLTTGLPNVTSFFAGLSNPMTAAAFFPTVEIPGVTVPFFPVEGLESALEAYLGDVKLSELSTYYVVHAYDLIARHTLYFVHDDYERGEAKTFTSAGISRNSPREFPPVPENAEDFVYEPDTNVTKNLDFYMRDVVRGSSAVAGFHEAKVLSPIDNPNITYHLIDGATITNNPALQALIFLSTSPRLIPIPKIAMISVGSGLALQDLAGNVDASTLGWLVNNELISIMADGSAEHVQSQVDFLFYGNAEVKPGQYLRIQVTADVNTTEGQALSRVTEPDDLPILRRLGVAAAGRYRKSIDRFVEDYIFA